MFEDASASIPLRRIDRAFEGANIRLAEDPGGSDGNRRAQFRRYVAGVDQRDRKQLYRLGDALGALIAEVAASKEDFLMKAAERDGFVFADGAFRPVKTAPNSFAVTHVEDLGVIEERGRRLHLLASNNPKDAIGGAKELVESVCRTVLRRLGEPAPGKTADVVDITKLTLEALELRPLGVVVAHLAELPNWDDLSPRHARLAVGAGVTFAAFVAETYAERARQKPTARRRASRA